MTTRDLMFFAEGDPETWNSWSGSSRSIVFALRRLGMDVGTADVGMARAREIMAKIGSFSLPRARWAQRFENGALAFNARSRNAAAQLPEGVPALQAGAGFYTPASELYCVCDANAAFAAKGGKYGPFSRLNHREIQQIIEREQSVYDRAAAIFCFTDAVRKSFIDDFHVSPDRVLTTYQGANLEEVPGDSVLTNTRSQAPTILFVGRMYERKGGATLVKAFADVRRAVPNAVVKIVGCEPPIGNTPGVEVLGRISRQELSRIFATAHIYCQPSHYEPFGTAFVEAMLYGLPCIASKEYGSEIVLEGETGWLVSADDASALAELLIEKLRDPARLRTAGAAARQRALELFTWDRVAHIIAERIRRR